jgi:hypothetical protein
MIYTHRKDHGVSLPNPARLAIGERGLVISEFASE